MEISDIKRFLGQTAIMRMTNGEVLKVKIDFVDDEDDNVAAAVLETSHPEHYRQPCAMHTFAASEIASVDLSS